MIEITKEDIKQRLSIEESDDEFDDKIQGVLNSYLPYVLSKLRADVLTLSAPHDVTTIKSGISLVLAGYYLIQQSNLEEDAESLGLSGLNLPHSPLATKRISRGKALREEGWEMLEDYYSDFIPWEVV